MPSLVRPWLKTSNRSSFICDCFPADKSTFKVSIEEIVQIAEGP